jgi:hypothetical protein
MSKHLSIEPEIKGFERMLRILENHRQRAGRDMYRESARGIVDYLHTCALRGTCDYQFADGAERAFTAVMQSLPVRGGLTRAPIAPPDAGQLPLFAGGANA